MVILGSERFPHFRFIRVLLIRGQHVLRKNTCHYQFQCETKRFSNHVHVQTAAALPYIYIHIAQSSKINER